jgi:hypothetical protein
MKDRNIVRTVLEVMRELSLFLFGITILAVFIGAMFAPLFSGVLTGPISKKIWNTPDITAEEVHQLQCHIRTIKFVLWVIAGLAWWALIAANRG